MSSIIQKYMWSELANVPATAGVYAWYYRLAITDFDLEKAIADISSLRDADSSGAAHAARELLDERLFRYFREAPYQASVQGPLKPTYHGPLEHAFEVSEGLISRIVENPDRLRNIRDVLKASAPMFASPLYIGMSIDLRARLCRHRALIEKYRIANMNQAPQTKDNDAGFAWQVAQRKIAPDRLFVYTHSTDTEDENIALDIENILNRLFYPIFGRN